MDSQMPPFVFCFCLFAFSSPLRSSSFLCFLSISVSVIPNPIHFSKSTRVILLYCETLGLYLEATRGKAAVERMMSQIFNLIVLSLKSVQVSFRCLFSSFVLPLLLFGFGFWVFVFIFFLSVVCFILFFRETINKQKLVIGDRHCFECYVCSCSCLPLLVLVVLFVCLFFPFSYDVAIAAGL